jgi:hypothetical protein
MAGGASGNRALRGRFASFACLVAGCLSASGCSDVGDSSAVPGQSVLPAGDDAATDSTDTENPQPEAATDAPSGGDATDSGVQDAGAGPDATVVDAGHDVTAGPGVDATVADAGVDGTVVVVDASTVDVAEAGNGADAGGPDASLDAPDATSGDAALPNEAGADTGPATVDASDGGGLVPCTASGQTACVQCQGNASLVCSPTEAAIVAFDIRQNVATAPGPDPNTSCYTCLLQAGCIDDTVFPDTGHECGDLPAGNFTAGSGSVGPATTLCLATVECVIGSACAETNGGLDNCYCGAGGGSPSLCPGNGPAANGACKDQETSGFLASPNDATNTLKNYTDTTEPSGMANQIFICALASSCSSCLE